MNWDIDADREANNLMRAGMLAEMPEDELAAISSLDKRQWFKLLCAARDACEISLPTTLDPGDVFSLVRTLASTIYGYDSDEFLHLSDLSTPKPCFTWEGIIEDIHEETSPMYLPDGTPWNLFCPDFSLLTPTNAATVLARVLCWPHHTDTRYSLAHRSLTLAVVVPNAHKLAALWWFVPEALIGRLSPVVSEHPAMNLYVQLVCKLRDQLLSHLGCDQLDMAPIRLGLRRVLTQEYRDLLSHLPESVSGEEASQAEPPAVRILDSHPDRDRRTWLEALAIVSGMPTA